MVSESPPMLIAYESDLTKGFAPLNGSTAYTITISLFSVGAGFTGNSLKGFKHRTKVKIAAETELRASTPFPSIEKQIPMAVNFTLHQYFTQTVPKC